jgi:hypothetical protein
MLARVGQQPGDLAVTGALVNQVAAAHQAMPFRPTGGMLGRADRHRGGQQPNGDAQPHLGDRQVVEELPDGDREIGRAVAKVQGKVVPEVLRHEDVAAQRHSRAADGQYQADPGEGGEGEAVPVPAALPNDQRLADHPGRQGQRGEPEQQRHGDQQPVGGREPGGSWVVVGQAVVPAAGLAGGIDREPHEAPPGRRM